MVDWKHESKRFDAVAVLYDQFRPSYPPDLLETILSVSEIPPGGNILEIGSGTGIATVLFAQRGYAILCVEPGTNLATIAKKKLQEFPKVSFALTTFEDWSVQEDAFDLVISAQAFHWIPREIGYAKASQALHAGGYIALFWNMYPDPKGAVFDALNQVYQKYTSVFNAVNSASFEELLLYREKDLSESGYFTRVEVKKFPWSERYDTTQYLGLLNTYSDHLRLPEDVRLRLFDDIAVVIERFGGFVEKPYTAVVYTAQSLS